MFKNTESSLSGVSSDGTTFEWRKNEYKKEVNSGDTIFPVPSAFKVYDKVSEKNRYVPRKWTQEEFEAALPQRFKQENSQRNQYPIDLAKDFEENDLKYENKKSPSSSEDTLPSPRQAVFQHLPKGPEINEKISHLKAVFEGAQNKDDCDQLSDTNELKSCKESEAKVILTNEQSPQEETTDGGLKCEENESEFIESCHNTYTSFMDGCLQCLLNLEPIVQPLDASYSAGKTCSSFDTDKLEAILETIQLSDKSNPEELQQLCLQDVFPKLYKEVQDGNRSLDEVLEFLLKSLIKENDQLRSLFQGKYYRSTVCERCETVVKEYQPFSFLNPASPPSDDHTLEVNIFSCKDGVWKISSKETTISPSMTVADLKEGLLNLPEFFDASGVSVIEIGEVMKGRLENLFDNAEELLELDLQPGSAIFAFHVLDYQFEPSREPDKDCSQAVNGFADMSYHLYFNCGLCLNDGQEVGLLMHQSCGGMVCRDCLDEILLTNTGWELCPCPICERPIDLEKELCKTKFSVETKAKQTQPDVVCAVVLRAAGQCDGRSRIELFGCPPLVSLPQQSSGSELYRFIGCLLPKTLPMKDKTSFTLHQVDSSGLRCATGCSSPDCTGCLIRINDNLILQPGACLAVHFDDLEEGSKRDFGVNIHERAQISRTQALFDGILQSCVQTCASKETLCPKCFNVCNTISSIIQFPQLLVIHLNEQFANKGLPSNMTIADVAQFFILERGNERDEDSKQGPTYHLTAAVLQKENSPAPMYEACTLGSSDNWLLYDGVQVSELRPAQLHLTSGSVLFYAPPLTDPGSSTADGQKLDSVGKGDNHVAFDNCCRELPDGGQTTKHHPRKTSAKQLHNYNDRFVLKSSSSQLEPGEWFPGNDLRLDSNRQSQLSLGEMERGTNVSSKGVKAAAWKDIDIISPINTTDVCTSESRVFQETKKLAKAVKREDAYDIVCSLNKGADPCALVNDVTALHLAAGIKSDQRYSVLTYLLRYARDVNVATVDGTTPLHVAAAWGHRDALELLLAHGGDPFELADIEGHSAFDLAVKDCSPYLQSVYHRQHSTHFLEISSSSYGSLPNHSALKAERHKEKRLEDIVRSNVGLPSFVEDNNNARLRRRWLHRLRNFRERSSGIFRNLRKISSIRRRSRIGVMVTDTALEESNGDVLYKLKTSSSLI